MKKKNEIKSNEIYQEAERIELFMTKINYDFHSKEICVHVINKNNN